jgi:protein TonB
MFSTLLESKGRVTRRTGGSIVSLAVHVTVVGAMVAATANATVRMPDDPQETTITFRTEQPAPATPPAASASTSDVFSNVAPALGAPALDMPIDVPTGIPPVDLSRGVTNSDDFQSGRRGLGTGIPGGSQAAAGADVYFSAQVEKPVMTLPGTPGPAFPEMLRAAGVEGQVVAEFVVDSTGAARMDTFRVLSSDHDLFSAAVRRSLERMRFLPAEVGQRRVAQMVHQTFQFALNRL